MIAKVVAEGYMMPAVEAEFPALQILDDLTQYLWLLVEFLFLVVHELTSLLREQKKGAKPCKNPHDEETEPLPFMDQAVVLLDWSYASWIRNYLNLSYWSSLVFKLIACYSSLEPDNLSFGL